MLVNTTTKKFDQHSFEQCFNLTDIEQTVEEACQTATQHPKALYLFMQRYTHFNSQAGSLVARLSSSIGLSRELFRAPDCEVYDEADRGLEVAARVFAATIDEHSDGKQHLPHRTLAQALLKGVGNYANLSVQERNEMSRIPPWFVTIMAHQRECYQGQPGNLEALVKAMGFHAASEVLADREYALIDKVIRYDNAGKGFDAYLRADNRKVEFRGQKISSWYWIVVHGTYKQSGVEYEHFEEALAALNLALEYLQLPSEVLFQWAVEGFSEFVAQQQAFFTNLNQECLELIKQELSSALS
jgi:hypothetical protein